MTESRRLRTQAERDADGTTWRATADTRPGYATYPTTPPGDPSWWRHDPGRGLSPVARVMAGLDGPPPVDGETCAKWCGFCHLNTEPAPTPAQCGNSTFPLIGGDALICTLAAGHDGGHRDDSGTEWIPVGNRSTLISQPPLRRRWWHRYTRRNP